MRRLLPFFLLVAAVVSSIIYFLGFAHSSDYIPENSIPKIIFNKACAECHGQGGEGELLYPALNNRVISEEEVMEAVQNGTFLMPAFPNIKDSTLKKLAKYVAERGYLKELD
jgi:cytochrome c553